MQINHIRDTRTLEQMHLERGDVDFLSVSEHGRNVSMRYTRKGFVLTWKDMMGVPIQTVRPNEAEAVQVAKYISKFGVEPARLRQQTLMGVVP